MKINSPLIVALDVASFAEAEHLVRDLCGVVSLFKVGLQLFTQEGPRVVEMIHKHGCEVFLDLKFHDIPHTVARACEAAAWLGVSLLTLHASGGRAMMETAANVVRKKGCPLRLLGVTVLTSESATADTRLRVIHLAGQAKEAGLHGVVCSGHEAQVVREACGKVFLIVVPGIRPAGSAVGDQKRVMTPREALDVGADYLVIGRPVLEAKDPRQTVQQILSSLKPIRGT